MNDWDTIEKMINTLPQWDIIKWIMSIQEELKCAKEDNLYQLRQNKNLQSKINKAIEFVESMKYCGQEDYFYDNKSKDPCGNDNTFNDSKNKLLDILKENK